MAPHDTPQANQDSRQARLPRLIPSVSELPACGLGRCPQRAAELIPPLGAFVRCLVLAGILSAGLGSISAQDKPAPPAASPPLFRYGTLFRGDKTKTEPPRAGQPANFEPADASPAPDAEPDPLPARRAAFQQATDLAARGDFAAALHVADELQSRPGEEGYAQELRGNVLVLKKDYAGAEASFRAMLKKVDASPVANFNVAEMVMLQGRYREAEERFGFLEDKNRKADPALADLCRFKRVVCLAAGGFPGKAEALLAPVPIHDPVADSPGSRYSRAAVLCVKKQFQKAATVIEHARSEFPEGVENLYADSFLELGWGHRDEHGVFVITDSPSDPQSRNASAATTVIAGYAPGSSPANSSQETAPPAPASPAEDLASSPENKPQP